MTDANREKQIAEAEALLDDQPQEQGFAKGLYFGQYLGDRLPQYPCIAADPDLNQFVERVANFL